ncbi:MAG TPA: hypothetical protein VGD55_04210 [Acidothermaceae bacterium]
MACLRIYDAVHLLANLGTAPLAVDAADAAYAYVHGNAPDAGDAELQTLLTSPTPSYDDLGPAAAYCQRIGVANPTT